MKITENTFDQVYVDINSKCNTVCPWCCNLKYKIPDITPERFEEICKGLPRPAEIRFLGGEPTIHPQLMDLIDIAIKHRHLLSIISNGIKFADMDFCLELKKHSPVVLSISMDSIVDRDVQYQALKNLHEARLRRGAITSTITEDNHSIIKHMRDIAEEFPSIRYLHFRNMINDRDAIPFRRLKELVAEVFPEWNDPKSIVRDGKYWKDKKCCGLCEVRWVTDRIQIMILDSSRAKECHIRGYVDNETLTINEFFLEIKRRNTL